MVNCSALGGAANVGVPDTGPADARGPASTPPTPATLDATFAALADPTRRAILLRLSRGRAGHAAPTATVTELAAPFQMSLPAVSKHIHVLERAGLLARRKDGRIHHMGLDAAPLRHAVRWLEHYRRFWEERLDALAKYLEEAAPEKEDTWQHRKRKPKPRSASNGRTARRGRPSSGRGPKRKR